MATGTTGELRPATAADADAVAHIWREGWADAHLGHVPDALVAVRTPASFAERARDRVADTTVATRQGTVVGFVMVAGDEVDQLYLDRTARGGGLGGALLRHAEAVVRAAGHDRAWLAVATGNAAGRRFYARQGWLDEGRFAHRAPVPGGAVEVECHRFRSPGR
ncbi:GNAT family N-acetyltransferase [Isoptericola sp. 4D.3]|uniref:GNAT family N-acetyltransferase n=1 Tax=Isoptericola peretonis TaxID=2918523 RepID=A0ABT0J8U5_9MICO|nr:GNAT family N-acetyltransferase [Isoptericola sp. 4D.3]